MSAPRSLLPMRRGQPASAHGYVAKVLYFVLAVPESLIYVCACSLSALIASLHHASTRARRRDMMRDGLLLGSSRLVETAAIASFRGKPPGTCSDVQSMMLMIFRSCSAVTRLQDLPWCLPTFAIHPFGGGRQANDRGALP